MYLRRDRRRRNRRIVAISALAVIAVLILTWPGDKSGLSLLTGRMPDKEQTRNTPALHLLVPPGQGVNKTIGQDGSSAGISPASPQPGATGSGTRLPPTTQPATAPAGRLAQAIPPTASRPASVGKGVPLPRDASALLQRGLEAVESNQPLEARGLINEALHSGLADAEARRARQALADLADKTLFSRAVIPNDPLVEWHTVRSGDTIGRIAKQAHISEELLARVNNLRSKNFIREGQRIKILRGPFHASIRKSTHEMDLYLQDVYVRTLRVALGENGSTPTGRWKAINQLENPSWTDPRTGKRWHADDPGNPIGEYWIGLEGVEGDAVGQVGYGIHGTIEPDTIGQDVSMGCVRLAPDNIAFVYQLIEPGRSYITINE